MLCFIDTDFTDVWHWKWPKMGGAGALKHCVLIHVQGCAKIMPLELCVHKLETLDVWEFSSIFGVLRRNKTM